MSWLPALTETTHFTARGEPEKILRNSVYEVYEGSNALEEFLGGYLWAVELKCEPVWNGLFCNCHLIHPSSAQLQGE